MKKLKSEMAIEYAEHIVKTKDTIRKTAEIYGLSKTYLQLLIHSNCVKSKPETYKKLLEILDEHFKEKHKVGGEKTRKKYLNV